MAGLWNRIADRGEGHAPLAAHLVKAAVYLVGRGVFTAAQAKTALESNAGLDLTGQETTDLNNILAQLNAQPTAVAKIDYLERLDALNIAAEVGVLTNEATWRSELGIT